MAGSKVLQKGVRKPKMLGLIPKSKENMLREEIEERKKKESYTFLRKSEKGADLQSCIDFQVLQRP